MLRAIFESQHTQTSGLINCQCLCTVQTSCRLPSVLYIEECGNIIMWVFKYTLHTHQTPRNRFRGIFGIVIQPHITQWRIINSRNYFSFYFYLNYCTNIKYAWCNLTLYEKTKTTDICTVVMVTLATFDRCLSWQRNMQLYTDFLKILWLLH